MVVQTNAATISEDSIAKAVIVIDNNATPPVRHAADELAFFLQQITGGEFQIVNAPVKDKSNLFVGPNAAKIAEPDFCIEGLGDEGLIIRTVGNDLILAGGHPRGTLYAVYTFLEDHLGCRWWTSKVSTIPKKPTIKIDDLNIRFVPILEYRESFWADARDGDWSVRNKSNGHFSKVNDQQGGKNIYEGFVHTFCELIPHEKYFKDHPEWFSMINGKRTATVDIETLNPQAKLTQLCLTNEQMRKELVKNLKAKLRANPKATIASVSQNDVGNYCKCPECEAVNQKEGSQAGTMISFVNAVAADIEGEFPNVIISTLAYQYTRKPPKFVKPRHNVCVRLCSIECSFAKPLTDERNKRFRDDIIGWSKICDRLYIWDYVTNFRHHLAPHPNLRVLAPNIKFFADNGAKGLFEQGCTSTEGAEMAELRAWVIAKLLWNPNLDGQELIDEFLQAYYGPADGHIKAHLNLIHDTAEKNNDQLDCFADILLSQIRVRKPPPDHAKSKFISFDTMNKSWTHLKAAENAVKDNPDLRFRVQVAQLPVMYSFMLCWDNMRRDAAEAGAKWPLSDSIQDVFDDFMKIAKKKNITRLSERIPGFKPIEDAVKKFG